MRRSPSLRMTPVSPCAPYPSMYSDQPTMPSSVVILRNELARHPASQCRSSILTIFIGLSPLGRHCEEQSDEAISMKGVQRARDCFASLAMTLRSLEARYLGEDRFEVREEQRRVLAHREVPQLLHDRDPGAGHGARDRQR